MGVKAKIFVFFLLFVAVVCVSGSNIRDCKEKCEKIRGAEQQQKLLCKQQCEYQEKQQEGQGGRGGDSGQYDIIFADEEREIRQMVEECHQGCQGSQGEQKRPECFQSCMQKQFQQHQQHQQRKSGDTGRRGRGQQGGKQQQLNNPYVFEDQHFTARLETQQGNVRFLQKFTDRSDLFKGIEKYRVAFLEAEPQTFVIPSHWDADALIFVVNGEGIFSLINEDARENHNIKRGDIFQVPAGISVYIVNRHKNERLVLVKILRSVSVPGELQTFLSVGGGNPESSFFKAFSTEVLEAAFNADRDSMERLFNQQTQQQQGIFKKVTEEQIKQLSGKDEVRTWPFGQRKGPYNIYKEKPSVANDNGNLYEVDSKDFSDLQEMNVAFSLYNISQGSMAGPFYNTKATVALVVTKGEGRFEMACPHLSEQLKSSTRFNPTYQQVTSNLRRGTVVVVPVGHPIVIEALDNQNLEVVSFALKTDKNEWFPLAGRDNVMGQWEDEALELTFGLPVKEIQKVIEKQNQRLFFKGPVRRGRAFV